MEATNMTTLSTNLLILLGEKRNVEETTIDMKTLFPNLIILLGTKRKGTLFDELKKSFNEYKYGPLYMLEGMPSQSDYASDHRSTHTTQIMMGGTCLAVGKGLDRCAAENNAVERFMSKLCDTCYVIEANVDYFGRKRVPACVLRPDPSDSHIFKVVCLKKNSLRIPFPHPLSGAIDFVHDYKQLLDYIEAHGKSGSKADLFILNVLKSDRKTIRGVCNKFKLNCIHMVGCSDQGILAFRQQQTSEILQGLLEAGGKTVKYRLIGPRNQFGGVDPKKEERISGETDLGEEEEVVVSQWIADHLIILEVFNEFSQLESTREIIWRSVKACPDLEEFIIEKTEVGVSRMIKASALIDRHVVGVARGFIEKEVKIVAAENAMQNLRKCCYYIEAKKSYFGSDKDIPEFLMPGNRHMESKLYKIVEGRETDLEINRILQQFKKSPHEDLFFLNDFSALGRRNLETIAKSMFFIVRRFGIANRVCISKWKSPKQVFMDLMRTVTRENEKYKLIVPPAKLQQQQEERTLKISRNEQHVNNPCQGNTEDLSEKDKESPSWIMNYIQSSQPLPTLRDKKRKKRQEKKIENSNKTFKPPNDVYSRYKFSGPRQNTFSSPSQIKSNFSPNTGANLQEYQQRSKQPDKREYFNQSMQNVDFISEPISQSSVHRHSSPIRNVYERYKFNSAEQDKTGVFIADEESPQTVGQPIKREGASDEYFPDNTHTSKSMKRLSSESRLEQLWNKYHNSHNQVQTTSIGEDWQGLSDPESSRKSVTDNKSHEQPCNLSSTFFYLEGKSHDQIYQEQHSSQESARNSLYNPPTKWRERKLFETDERLDKKMECETSQEYTLQQRFKLQMGEESLTNFSRPFDWRAGAVRSNAIRGMDLQREQWNNDTFGNNKGPECNKRSFDQGPGFGPGDNSIRNLPKVWDAPAEAPQNTRFCDERMLNFNRDGGILSSSIDWRSGPVKNNENGELNVQRKQWNNRTVGDTKGPEFNKRHFDQGPGFGPGDNSTRNLPKVFDTQQDALQSTRFSDERLNLNRDEGNLSRPIDWRSGPVRNNLSEELNAQREQWINRTFGDTTGPECFKKSIDQKPGIEPRDNSTRNLPTVFDTASNAPQNTRFCDERLNLNRDEGILSRPIDWRSGLVRNKVSGELNVQREQWSNPTFGDTKGSDFNKRSIDQGPGFGPGDNFKINLSQLFDTAENSLQNTNFCDETVNLNRGQGILSKPVVDWKFDAMRNNATGELNVQREQWNNHTFGDTKRPEFNKRSIDKGPGFGSGDNFKRNVSQLFDTPENVSQHSGHREEKLNLNKDEGPSSAFSTGFEKRSGDFPKTKQLWNKEIKQAYDARYPTKPGGKSDLSSLFDGVQGPSRPAFQSSSPVAWKKNQQFKKRGRKFGKTDKYGKKPY